MSWIETYHNHKIDFADPDPAQIDIRDIIHVLPRLGRFNAHTPDHYSVAEHAYLMSLQVPPEDRPWALLHDAAEAYMGDIPAPLKQLCPEAGKIEDRLLRAIAEAMALDWPMPDSVKEADRQLLKMEYDTVTVHERDWPALDGVKPFPESAAGWSEPVARVMFASALHTVGFLTEERFEVYDARDLNR